jgi:hypothetical protein
MGIWQNSMAWLGTLSRRGVRKAVDGEQDCINSAST